MIIILAVLAQPIKSGQEKPAYNSYYFATLPVAAWAPAS